MSTAHTDSESSSRVTNFDTATQRLEDIIRLMDDPETSLEEMIALVEEGMKLKRACVSVLQQAELRIKQLEAPSPAPPTSTAAQAASSTQQDHDFTLL